MQENIETQLMSACKGGNFDLVLSLIEQGADINATYDVSFTIHMFVESDGFNSKIHSHSWRQRLNCSSSA